jgi:hypothetical protein
MTRSSTEPAAGPRPGLLGRVGRACHRHRWITLTGWLAAVACLITQAGRPHRQQHHRRRRADSVLRGAAMDLHRVPGHALRGDRRADGRVRHRDGADPGAGHRGHHGRRPAKHKAGVGSAVNDATRLFGGTLGGAVIGSVAASLYSSRPAGQPCSPEPEQLEEQPSAVS